MSFSLRPPAHAHITPGRDVVEVWDGDRFMASVYPTESGIRIVSKHGLTTTRADDESTGLEIVHVHVGAA